MNTHILPKDSQQVRVRPIDWDRPTTQQEREERIKQFRDVALDWTARISKPFVEKSIENRFPDMEKARVKEVADTCIKETKGVIKKATDKSIEHDKKFSISNACKIS